MDGLLLPLLIAGAVALFAFAGAQAFQATFNPDRRKLKERLTSMGRSDGKLGASKQITHQQQKTDNSLEAAVMKIGLLHNLNRSLIQAYPDAKLAKFLGVALALASSIGAIVYCLSWSSLVALVGFAIGLYIPFMIITGKKNKRQKTIVLQLPEALDFLSRILRAGHSLSTGLQMMGEELPKPLGVEFRKAYDQHSLGIPLEDALRDMTRRIESSDFAFFVTAVLIQRSTGGDLSEVLNNISGMIRQRIKLSNSVKSKTAEGRFTGYILSAFPAVMFVVASSLNREYASVLWTDTTGQMMLGGAFGLTILGLFVIKKITTVKV